MVSGGSGASCRRHASGVAAREDVEDHVGGVDAFAQCFRTGGLNRFQPVDQHGAENIDHLAIAVRHTRELALHAPHRR